MQHWQVIARSTERMEVRVLLVPQEVTLSPAELCGSSHQSMFSIYPKNNHDRI